MVFELDPDLALGGLVSDEGVLEQLLGRRSAGIRLHKAALNKVDKFLGPGTKGGRTIHKLEKVGKAEHNTVGSWSAEHAGSQLPDSLSERLYRKVCLQSLTWLLAMSIRNFCLADSRLLFTDEPLTNNIKCGL